MTIMTNPRKFSEKIALHNQKQAEETAAFDAIMREVSATRQPQHAQPASQIHLSSPQLGAYRGGSLPNVNQTSIDLQGALNNLENMKQGSGRQSLIDRHRQRQTPSSRRSPLEKRSDYSPYGSCYLSPPDPNWRRTASDSALHTKSLCQQLGSIGVQNETMSQGDNYYTQSVSRPKSCEVPCISVYPSPEQGLCIPANNANTGSLPDLTTIHFPPPLSTPLDNEDSRVKSVYTNATSNVSQLDGLPNLCDTTLHTDQSGKVCAVNSLSSGYVAIKQENPSSELSHKTNLPQLVTSNIEKSVHHSPPDAYCQYPNFYNLSQQKVKKPSEFCYQQRPFQNHDTYMSDTKQNLSSHSMSPDTSHSSEKMMLFSQYANNRDSCGLIDNVHHSPTTPHPKIVISSIDNECSVLDTSSQSLNLSKIKPRCSGSIAIPQDSFQNKQCEVPSSHNTSNTHSPLHSPSSPNSLNESTFSEGYFSSNVQSQVTNALQQQFEQFNMIPDNSAASLYKNMADIPQHGSSIPGMTFAADLSGNLPLSQLYNKAHSNDNHMFFKPSFAKMQSNNINEVRNDGERQTFKEEGTINHHHTPSHSPQPPGSPQLSQAPHSPILHCQQFPNNSLPQFASQLPPSELTSKPMTNLQIAMDGHTKKIPDITFTGADESSSKHDFSKELGNAMASMNDFELFPTDEALRIGLDPLDLDGLQMLTDPNMVTDPATEDSFRLDRL